MGGRYGFTIRDFVNKHQGHIAKKLTDDELRHARIEAWHEGGNA